MRRSQIIAVMFAGLTLLSLVLIYQPEKVKIANWPYPTAKPVIERLQELGATWKLNRHGQVVRLNLKRLPLADDDLQILHALPELKTLNLRGIHTIKGNAFTDDGLRHLVGLRNLELLDVSANSRLTDASSQWIGQLTSLKLLTMTNTGITAKSLPNLSRLRNLQWFSCNRIELTADTAQWLKKLPLREVRNLRVREDSIPLLAQLRDLKKLPRGLYDKIRDVDLKYIVHLTHIERLRVELTHGWQDCSQLHYLQSLPRLKSLHFGTRVESLAQFDRAGFAALAEIPSLKMLDPNRINDEILAAISELPQVVALELSAPHGELTSEGLLALREMRSLKAIALPRKLVTDRTIEVVSEIESLEVLGLDGRNLFDSWSSYDQREKHQRNFSIPKLAVLARIPNLKSLYLDNWDLGSAAMPYLAQISSLESLSISPEADRYSGVPISEPALLQLRHLSNLKYLNLYGTRTDMDAAEKLSEFLPECFMEDNWCCGCMTLGPHRFWSDGGVRDYLR